MAVSISAIFRGQAALSSEVQGDPVLELAITDSATGQRLPARVRVRDAAGRDYVPVGALEVRIGRDRWFIADGSVKIGVPAGRLNLRVERGTEYTPLIENFEVAAAGTTRHEAVLKCWINLRELGYAGGEYHLHVSPGELGARMSAEGLEFGGALAWWNGPKFAVAESNRHGSIAFGTNRMQAANFNAEIEKTWGAVYLFGLKQPLVLASDARTPNLPFVRLAHESGALVSYQGGWSREAALDALLGYVDVINVCNNDFHRHKFQPRRLHANLFEIPGFPEYPDTPEGMMRMSLDAYYRLLNCGLHLAAGAESAAGAKTTPPGYNRTYVRLAPDASVADFAESWRRGRGFTTDGPMIFLTVNGSNSPGDEIAFPEGGGKIRARVQVRSDQPLQSLEIVVNGAVIGVTNFSSPIREGHLETEYEAKQGCWIAARATAEDRLLSDAELARYDNGLTKGLIEKPSRLVFGHTSPVYVSVGGAGTAVAASVREARQLLDAFEKYAATNAAPAYQEELRAALTVARKRLDELKR